MRGIVLLLLAWALGGQPTMTLQWAPGGLLVQRHISGCLSLEGGGLPARALPAIPCDASPVFLPSGNIDFASAPQKRDYIILRTPLGEELGRTAIPPRRWEVILPIVVR